MSNLNVIFLLLKSLSPILSVLEIKTHESRTMSINIESTPYVSLGMTFVIVFLRKLPNPNTFRKKLHKIYFNLCHSFIDY